MSLVLFTQVAFDLSYDNFYPDVDRIYRIRRQLSMGNGGGQEKMEMNMPIINAPVPAAMMAELPEVEKATVMASWSYDGEYTPEGSEQAHIAKTMITDSLFLDLMGLPLLQGSVEGFRDPSCIYLSETTARRIFGDADPMGQSLAQGGEVYTVKGVFRDLPKNCHLSFDVLKSMVMFGSYPGWHNNDAYVGYVKFAPGATPAEAEAKIPAMLAKYYDLEAEIKSGTIVRYYFEPISGIHLSEPAIRKTVLILWLMALAILLVAAMNYVLISISSLANRAKSIGVHKCNGASGGNIFSMFIYETIALILVSVVLAVLLIFAFRGQIEVLLHTSLAAIFVPQNLWVSGLVIVVLILIAGVLPGRLFSFIPVTAAFRSMGTNKKRWKQVLLFVQFTGIAFMVMLLAILMKQYATVLSEDLGYDTENVIYAQNVGDLSPERLGLLKEEFSRFPQVERASVATSLPFDGMSGQHVIDLETQEMLFSTRFIFVDKDYLDVMGLSLKLGTNFPENTSSFDKVLVNEKFVEMAGIKDNPIGKRFDIMKTNEIIGVVKDYHLGSLYTEQMPLVILPMKPGESSPLGSGVLILRLTSPDRKAARQFDEQLRAFTNSSNSYFRFCNDAIELSYTDARLLRNSIFVAALVLLIISIMGIIGYTADEIFRRTKEIAVRRINGASVSHILRLISTDIMLIALPSVIVGMVLASILGQKWQEQFVVKAPLDATLFLVTGVFVLLVVYFFVALRSWRAASDNPVNSLKTE